MPIRHRDKHDVGKGFHEHDTRINYFVKFESKQNFGDYLPEILCKELLTYPRIEADMFRLIGSVIHEKWIKHDLLTINGCFSGTIAFWCCGARGPEPISSNILSHCHFFGVRGPLTRDLLGLPADTVMGDPGLLAPLFHTPRPHLSTLGKVVCIPHIHDARSAQVMLSISGADVVVNPEISASEHDLREVLDRIASAEFVLTASLHGAIIACAYGRPFCFWDNGHIDVPFKWADFALSVNIPNVFASNVDEARIIWRESVAPVVSMPSLSKLLDASPILARPSALLRAIEYDLGQKNTFLESINILDSLAATSLPEIYHLQETSSRRRKGAQSFQIVIARLTCLPLIKFGRKVLRRFRERLGIARI